MKRMLLACTALVSFAAVPAFAADLIVEVEEVAAAPADLSWTGLYLGIAGAYGYSDFTGTAPDLEPFDGGYEFSPDGWLGTLYLGYNFQLDNGLVLGVEGDYSFGELTDEVTFIDLPDFDLGAYDAVAEVSVDSFATLRGRVGFAAGSFMPYLTGGAAFAKANLGVAVDFTEENFPSDYAEDSADLFGWVIGAGVEYALTENLVAKAEYLYADLGSADMTLEYEPPYAWSVETDVVVQTAKIGLAYKF